MNNLFFKSKVLFVVAHPDDELLGCGGTIAKLVENRCEVKVLILGEGIMSRESHSPSKQREELSTHQQCILNAKNKLGYQHIEIHQLPDNKFDSLPRLEVIKIIENSKKDFNPDVVFTHHLGDLNIDHRITFESVLTAFRPIKGENATGIYTFETPSSTEWSFQLDSQGFRPNIYIEISEKNFEMKVSALKEYIYEVRDFPHPRSLKYLEILAKKRGAEVGFDLAESFLCIRQKIF